MSKEKKICLICKVKLRRTIFICPGCNSFYCEKCLLTLNNLENMCWVCNIPLDKQKPVKRLKSEEQQVKIEEIDKFRNDLVKNKKIE